MNRPEADQTAASKGHTDDAGENLAGTLPSNMFRIQSWHGRKYHAWRNLTRGFALGALAGCTSLLANVIGSVFWPAVSGEPQHPLRLIQVFLTFPLGERALQLDAGALLALACVLYLVTGMVYGAIFQFLLSYFVPYARVGARLLLCSVLAIVIWAVNFYGILLWLQPLLVQGRWIVDLIPWWVAALTHVVFGWTMALIYPLGSGVRWRVT